MLTWLIQTNNMRRGSLLTLFTLKSLLRFSVCSTLLMPALLFAQETLINVRSKVSSTSGVVEGATVVIKGKSKATTTNNLGEFVLDGLTKDDIIVISAVGYITKEIRAGIVGATIELQINNRE